MKIQFAILGKYFSNSNQRGTFEMDKNQNVTNRADYPKNNSFDFNVEKIPYQLDSLAI